MVIELDTFCLEVSLSWFNRHSLIDLFWPLCGFRSVSNFGHVYGHIDIFMALLIMLLKFRICVCVDPPKTRSKNVQTNINVLRYNLNISNELNINRRTRSNYYYSH